MAYDESLFEKIADIGKVKAGKGELSVLIFRYGEGEAKIKIQRLGAKKNGETFYAEMGNLTAEEAAGLAPLLVKAAAELKKVK